MLSKKFLLVFSFILLLNSVSAGVEVTHEDSTVSRIVGNTPNELAKAFDQTEINLTHATFYSKPRELFAGSVETRKGKVLENIFSPNYAEPYPLVKWSWEGLGSELSGWQTNEFFVLETEGGFENGELVTLDEAGESIYWSDSSKLFPYNTGWENAFKQHHPLFLFDSDYSGLYLPNSFDNESFVGQLGQDSLMVAPTAVPDMEFSLAFICAMASMAATQRGNGRYDWVWRIYNKARNNYYKYAGTPSGKALMSYELYGMPYTKISIPNKASESYLKTWCENYAVKPPVFGQTPLSVTKKLVNQVSVSSVQALDSNTYTQEFVVDSSDYNVVSDGNLSWLHLPENQLHKELFKLALPEKIYSTQFPLNTVIKNIELISLNDPIDLTIEDLPMWDNGLVERECYDNNYLAGISFPPPVTTEDSVFLFIVINPVQVIDCNTGQLRLYKTIKYKVDYVPNSPVLIEAVNVEAEASPNELIDVNVLLKNTTGSTASGTLAIVDDENNLITQQNISTTSTQFTLQFNAPSKEGVKIYELKFIQNSETKTFKKFYFKVSSLEARLAIPETNGESTTIQVELNNNTSNSMNILLNYYLIKDNNVLQSGSINQEINPGLNLIPISYIGLTKENRSYETEVDLNYSIIPTSPASLVAESETSSNKKILFGSITTNHPPALDYIPDITVRETETVTITPHATDLDGDPVTYSISNPVGNDGNWATQIGDKGNYTVTVTASDGLLSDSQNVNITILNANRAPTIDEYNPAESELTIAADSNQLFSIAASDPDNDPLTITWYLDGNAVSNNENYLFNASDFFAGAYNLSVVVLDGTLSTSLEWKINVPVFISITLTECPSGGEFNYGSQSSGATNIPMQCQNNLNGAIKIMVEDSTNIAIDLNASGTDYIGPNGYTIPVQNTKLDTDGNASAPAPIPLSETPHVIFTNLGGKKLEEKQLWLWIDTPSEWIPGGEYTGTYMFNAEPAT